MARGARVEAPRRCSAVRDLPRRLRGARARVAADGGRDLDEYLLAYVQLFDRTCSCPWSMLFRTPVTPLFAGALARPLRRRARGAGDGGAVRGLDRLLGRCGALLRSAGRARRRRRAPRVPGLRAHVPRALERARVRGGVRGLGPARRARDVRPDRRPLRARRPGRRRSRARPARERRAARLRDRARSSSRVHGAHGSSEPPPSSLAAVLPLAAWSVHNGVRFDSWGLARGGNAIVPFYRAFITDHIVSPENGEDSRRLAAAMQQHLLTREPYRSYGVTLDELFREGSFRVHEDLYLLSDQVFGWDSDYGVLRGAGVEGVRAHPGTYARGVSRTIWDELVEGAVPGRLAGLGRGRTRPRRAGDRRDQRQAPAGADRGRADPGRVRSSGSRGPTRASARSGRRRPSGTSSSSTRRTACAFEQITRETGRPLRRAPGPRTGTRGSRSGSTSSRAGIPRPWMWILLGLIAIAVRRPRGLADPRRARARRLRGGAAERARPLRRPPLPAAGRARVRPPGPRRAARRAAGPTYARRLTVVDDRVDDALGGAAVHLAHDLARHAPALVARARPGCSSARSMPATTSSNVARAEERVGRASSS